MPVDDSVSVVAPPQPRSDPLHEPTTTGKETLTSGMSARTLGAVRLMVHGRYLDLGDSHRCISSVCRAIATPPVDREQIPSFVSKSTTRSLGELTGATRPLGLGRGPHRRQRRCRASCQRSRRDGDRLCRGPARASVHARRRGRPALRSPTPCSTCRHPLTGQSTPSRRSRRHRPARRRRSATHQRDTRGKQAGITGAPVSASSTSSTSAVWNPPRTVRCPTPLTSSART